MDRLKSVIIFSKDKNCLNCLKRVMNKRSNEVYAFTQEEEVLNHLRIHKADIVIMSMLTDKNGSPICEAIRALQKELPIILVANEAGIGDYSLYFKGVDTIESPIDAEVLMRKVDLYKKLTEVQLTLDSISSLNRRIGDR